MLVSTASFALAGVIMLHAFARNKSRAYQRYLGVRETSEPRVSSEDEITSLIFGPLDFLPASDNWALWKLILQNGASSNRSAPLPSDYFEESFSPSACTLEFWPRKDRIEPDLHIRFLNEQGESRSLLVEVKWDAPPSGDDQLDKQWLDYQSGSHASSLHVFIAKRIDKVLPQQPSWACLGVGGAEGSRLRLIRWHEFRHEIAKLAGAPHTSVALRRWSLLISNFLEKVGIRPFVGFQTTARLADALEATAPEPEQFWFGAPSARFR